MRKVENGEGSTILEKLIWEPSGGVTSEQRSEWNVAAYFLVFFSIHVCLHFFLLLTEVEAHCALGL